MEKGVILVVDRSLYIQEETIERIKEAGFNVVIASHISKAIEAIDEDNKIITGVIVNTTAPRSGIWWRRESPEGIRKLIIKCNRHNLPIVLIRPSVYHIDLVTVRKSLKNIFDEKPMMLCLENSIPIPYTYTPPSPYGQDLGIEISPQVWRKALSFLK